MSIRTVSKYADRYTVFSRRDHGMGRSDRYRRIPELPAMPLSKDAPNRFTCDRAALVSGGVACRGTGHPRSDPTPVRLHVSAGNVALEVICTDVGTSNATVDAATESRPMTTIAFNPSYLLAALAVGTTSRVSVAFVDGLKPATILDVDATGPTAAPVCLCQ